MIENEKREIINLTDVTYIYNQGNTFEKVALDNVNLKFYEHDFVGFIGHTGSGKSTLLQLLNGLLKPTYGKVSVDGIDTSQSGLSKTGLRQKVGLVFQYPEYQLFEETVYKDVAFGPKNMGLSDEEVSKRVEKACIDVGLDFEKIKDNSPFELSGGQKRRVAIAGVMAMEPDILILDEPAAGLDPKGRKDIFENIIKVYNERKITVVVVSHSMEDVAKFSKRIIVINKGKIFLDGTPEEVFEKENELNEIGLGIPKIVQFVNLMKNKGVFSKEFKALTVEDAVLEIVKNKEKMND